MNRDSLDGVVSYLAEGGLKVVTAESCTAGLIASTLAEPPGCGAWLDAAFVTYSEEATTACLEVAEDSIATCPLTGEDVARATAVGALAPAPGNPAIAPTGVAGPSAGAGEAPVVTVCIASSFKSADGIQTFA